MALAADIAQHYEVLRSQVLADESDRVLSQSNVSVTILIGQGIIGWSKLWDRCGKHSELRSLVSKKATDSGSEARLSFEREAEIKSILVNMSVQHLKNSRIQELKQRRGMYDHVIK